MAVLIRNAGGGKDSGWPGLIVARGTGSGTETGFGPLGHGAEDGVVPADRGAVFVVLGLGVAHLVELRLQEVG